MITTRGAALSTAALLLGALAVPVAPATGAPSRTAVLRLTVTTRADTNDATPGHGPCADSTHRCSLRGAIEIADARQVPVAVTLPGGTFVVHSSLEVDDTGGLVLTGATRGATTISGGATVPPLVVGNADALGVGTSVAAVTTTITSVTLTDGRAAASGAFADDGGCLVVASANAAVTMRRGRVSHCAASGDGGGVYSVGRLQLASTDVVDDTAVDQGGGVDQASGNLVVSQCVVEGDSLRNLTGEADGAGLYAAGDSTVSTTSFVGDHAVGDPAFGGGAEVLGTATLSGDSFDRDELSTAQPAYDTDGAGLYAVGPVTVSDATFAHDRATGRFAYGGGASSEGGLELTGSRLVADVADGTQGGYGGGLYAEGGATLVATTFDHDVAESARQSYGGGLYVQDSTSVLDGTFVGDAAVNGVGGGLFAAGVGTFVDRSSFTANRASGGTASAPSGPGYGGALAADSATRVLDSVLARNRADQGGGGVLVAAPVSLVGTLVEANRAPQGAGVYDYWLLSGSSDALIDNVATGAHGGGGGLFLVGATGTGVLHSADLAATVVAGNVAPVGAGIEFEGGASGSGGGSFRDVRIGGNRTPAGLPSECAFVGPLALRPISLGGNVTGDGSCDLRGPTDRPGPAAQGYWLATDGGAVAARDVPQPGRVASDLGGITPLPGDAGLVSVAEGGLVRSTAPSPLDGDVASRLGGGMATGIATTLDGEGGWVVASSGAVVPLGDAASFGSARGHDAVAIAPSVDGRGYELLYANGAVRGFGDAPRLASHAGIAAVALAMTPDGQGYWELSSTGAVYAFGDARSFGGARMDALAVLPTPDGRGYLLVSASGQVVARGDARRGRPAHGTFVAAAAT